MVTAELQTNSERPYSGRNNAQLTFLPQLDSSYKEKNAKINARNDYSLLQLMQELVFPNETEVIEEAHKKRILGPEADYHRIIPAGLYTLSELGLIRYSRKGCDEFTNQIRITVTPRGSSVKTIDNFVSIAEHGAPVLPN